MVSHRLRLRGRRRGSKGLGDGPEFFPWWRQYKLDRRHAQDAAPVVMPIYVDGDGERSRDGVSSASRPCGVAPLAASGLLSFLRATASPRSSHLHSIGSARGRGIIPRVGRGARVALHLTSLQVLSF